MRILVAPDKFRGSLEADSVCRAMEEGILLAYPDAKVVSVPLADGGEGTTQILTRLAQGRIIKSFVRDPLGRIIEASYGLSAEGDTAYIEMASASGLNLLDRSEYNPLLTSTFGTGQLLVDALEKGVKNIILGIGGSATNDGGAGMAAALGYRFFDKKDEPVHPTGGNLNMISRIDTSGFNSKFNNIKITIACDVTNPLFGTTGAAYIYASQKGASVAMIADLDMGLQNLAKVAGNTFGKNISENPGAGAAGGLGAGCLWFLNAELKEGVGIVMEQANIAEQIRHSDLVITGEGKVDSQTLSGKVVKGLADLCQKADVPLAVVCGTLLISAAEIRSAGITYAVSVLNQPMDLDTAQSDAYRLVKEATFNLVRLFFSKK